MNLKDEKFATLPQRLMAYNIDMLVFFATVIPLSLFIDNDRLMFIMGVISICLYHALMESSKSQGTPGKIYTKLMVVDKYGGRISPIRALLRIICKFLSLLLFFVGFFIIYFRKDRRGLHDIIAKTYVICR